jgi:hypothetical protein
VVARRPHKPEAIGSNPVPATKDTMNFCEVCGKPYAQKHHIVSRRVAGKFKDIVENIIYLCADHHTMGPDAVHNMGRWSFAEKFKLTEGFERAIEAVSLASRR